MKTGQILKQKSEVLLDQGEQMLSIQTTDGCPAQVDEEIILNETWSSEVRPEGPHSKKAAGGASLVAQWLRISLPMRGTQVRALVWEDPTCCGATRPVSHNY